MNIKKNETWRYATMAITPEYIKGTWSADDYNKKSKEEKKKALLFAYSKNFEIVSKGHEGNWECFFEGHKDSTPSMVFDKDRGHWHCYGCMQAGKNYDLFDLIGDFYGLKSFKEKYAKAEELFVKGSVLPAPDTEKTDKKPYKGGIPNEMFKIIYDPHYHPITEDKYAIQYLKSRGISLETAQRLFVRTWEFQACFFLVFPNDNGSYVRRKFGEGTGARSYANLPDKWWNSKGDGGYFNERSTDTANGKPVFIVESAINALSIEELGYRAVGLNSVNKLGEYLKSHDYRQLILLMDNDPAGEEIYLSVPEHKNYYRVKYSDFPFIGEYGDINDCLKADRDKTKAALDLIYKAAKDFYMNKEN